MFERWVAGMRTFLWSNAAQFFFTSMAWDEQRFVVERIIRDILSMDEQKLQKGYVASIVEETLTKRPYAKHLTMVLYEGRHTQGLDVGKLAKECLKNLTSEDLF